MRHSRRPNPDAGVWIALAVLGVGGLGVAAYVLTRPRVDQPPGSLPALPPAQTPPGVVPPTQPPAAPPMAQDSYALETTPLVDNLVRNPILAVGQRQLVALGFRPGRTDGTYDAATRVALQAYVGGSRVIDDYNRADMLQAFTTRADYPANEMMRELLAALNREYVQRVTGQRQ